jgi:hypothetical protein
MPAENDSQSNIAPHIADVARIESLIELYRPVFADTKATREFCETVENLPPTQNKPKILLHQATRMIWLADQIERVAAGRPAFQILFYLIAAELVAKIVFNFGGEGQSRKYVHRFFTEICSDESKKKLAQAFRHNTGQHLSFGQAVDLLYNVRCSVVHEGRYFEFTLRRETDGFSVLTGYDDTLTDMTIGEIRQIVLEGAILGCRKLLESSSE